ncbi:hypothetical protein ACYULU_07895 [Breznakiellaceae bacterium SP9]
MSQTDLLLEKVEGLSPDYMTQIFDFIDQLKHRGPTGENESVSIANITTVIVNKGWVLNEKGWVLSKKG